MAGVLALTMLAVRLGIDPWLGHLEPRLTVEAVDRLLVDRPAFATQQGPDAPVAVPWVRPGQFLDASCQRRRPIAGDRGVAEAGSGQIQRPRDAALRHAESVA